MAYTKNAAVGKRLLPLMEPLAHGKSARWDAENPQKWAYKVREFLFIVLSNKSEPAFQPFLQYAEHYRVTVDGNVVQAELNLADPTDYQVQMRQVTAATPGQAIAGRGTRVLVGPKSSFEVIQFWLGHQPTNDMMTIQECNLSNKELEEISRFLMMQPRPWMAMLPKGTATLVLAPDDPHVPAEAKITVRPPRPATPLRDTSGRVIIEEPTKEEK